jgi:shikimate kinase
MPYLGIPSFQTTRIILIGFRGSGKTTIGKGISRLLNWVYISTDELIESEAGCSIIEFVEKEGWQTFRRLEAKVIEGLREKKNAVIDCGGGVVENSQNIEILTPGSLVVWVDAKMEDIHTRLNRDANRPLLNQKDLRKDIEFNYRRRQPLYRRYSHHYANTSEDNPGIICRKIIRELSS